MSPASVSSVSFFCLLVLLLQAQHGASSYASYKLGSRQVFFKTLGKSSGNSQQASTMPPADTCSSIATTGLGNHKLPVVHRLSPCSPLHGLPSLTTADVKRRDISRIRRMSPAAIIIPINSSETAWPGDYTVVISYGTPEQQLPMLLGITIGTTVLWCRPCTSASNNCNPAFDTSRSSTFAYVLCGSPDCPTKCYNGSVCPSYHMKWIGKGTFAEDVLTLAPSMAIHNFRLVCADVNVLSGHLPALGILDLSRGINSLPSQLSSSWPTLAATFSYCLPQLSSSQGFLALGGNATVGNDDYNLTSHAPLVNSIFPDLSSMYFIDVVGMRLGGEDLPISAGTFGGSNARTAVNMELTLTWLATDAYLALRDAFRKEMSQYSNLSVPGFAGLDTCFNFTGLDEIIVPVLEFKFSNGESLGIREQMLYYDDPATGPFGMACLAYVSMEANDVFSAVIGTHTLLSTEVVYDVAGGKVGFIPYSC